MSNNACDDACLYFREWDVMGCLLSIQSFSCKQVAPPPPPKKSKTVEMAQGKWAEVLVHSDRVTKVLLSLTACQRGREGALNGVSIF